MVNKDVGIHAETDGTFVRYDGKRNRKKYFYRVTLRKGQGQYESEFGIVATGSTRDIAQRRADVWKKANT